MEFFTIFAIRYVFILFKILNLNYIKEHGCEVLLFFLQKSEDFFEFSLKCFYSRVGVNDECLPDMFNK